MSTPLDLRWAQTRPALIGLAAAWLSVWSWSAMVTGPGRYLAATLLTGAVMVLLGVELRHRGLAPWTVAGAQLVVGLVGLDAVGGRGRQLAGLVPTPGSVLETLAALVHGAGALDRFASPVAVDARGTATTLTACGLLVVLAVDVLALGVRRPPLAALPLLVALSVPISVLRGSLALPVFIGTALLLLRLLASDQLDRPSADGTRPPGAAGRTFWQVGLAAVVLALVAAPVVPVSDLLQRDHSGTAGAGGTGGSLQLTTVNPFIQLRRDLVTEQHVPLVRARTDAASTSYLRTTVLDEFTQDAWQPSPRNLPSSNDADGPFPDVPGLSPSVPGSTDSWRISLDPRFATSWLPLPYPVLSVSGVHGWRYDTRTLDVAYVTGDPQNALGDSSGRHGYTVKAFTPDITADELRTRNRAPRAILESMTRLPQGFPSVITATAQRVTKGATTDYDKAVALQSWFREGGGFTYSLAQRSGSGMDLLAHFVTDDRVGYCEQFAAAMAGMGRALGIPSRVVVGFLDGTTQADGSVLYTSDERHAWPEMYFNGIGWVRFEPTPGSRSGASPPWTRVVGTARTPTTAPSVQPSRAPVRRTPTDTAATTHRSTDRSLPWKAIGSVALLVFALVTPTLTRRLQRRRRLRAEHADDLAEGAWRELRADALDLGLDWPEQRSPREQAARVSAQVGAQVPVDDERQRRLQELVEQVERARYAPGDRTGLATLAPQSRRSTEATLASWQRAMRESRTGPRWRRGLWRWWPRSVLRSRD